MDSGEAGGTSGNLMEQLFEETAQATQRKQDARKLEMEKPV